MTDTLQSLLAYLKSIGATQKHEPNCYWVAESRRDELLNFVADMRAETLDKYLFIDFPNHSIKIQFYASKQYPSQAPTQKRSLIHKVWEFLHLPQ